MSGGTTLDRSASTMNRTKRGDSAMVAHLTSNQANGVRFSRPAPIPFAKDVNPT